MDAFSFFFCKHEAHDAFSFYNDTNNKINIINCNLIFLKNQRFEMKIKNKKKPKGPKIMDKQNNLQIHMTKKNSFCNILFPRTKFIFTSI
jgi:hypothetical protein